MRTLKKTFRLLSRDDASDVDPAKQAQAVIAAYHAALTEHELDLPNGGFTMYVVADDDGDGDAGDQTTLYCVSDRYASWYVLATGITAEVIAFYAYAYDGWCEEDCFAYSEQLDDMLKTAGVAPADEHERAAWLVKALNADPDAAVTKRGYVPIAKSDVQRYTLGVAYPHSEIDSHGDFTDSDELEQAAWNFMRNVVAKGAEGVGTDHADGTDGAATVVESYIYRGPEWTIEVGDDETVIVKDGDWMVGAIWTPEAWERVEKGDDITGWSIQGLAFVDEDADLPETA